MLENDQFPAFRCDDTCHRRKHFATALYITRVYQFSPKMVIIYKPFPSIFMFLEVLWPDFFLESVMVNGNFHWHNTTKYLFNQATMYPWKHGHTNNLVICYKTSWSMRLMSLIHCSWQWTRRGHGQSGFVHNFRKMAYWESNEQNGNNPRTRSTYVYIITLFITGPYSLNIPFSSSVRRNNHRVMWKA